MYSVLVILAVIVAILLVLVVSIQESKGGGLASNFSASNQIMGVRKTTDVVEKAIRVEQDKHINELAKLQEDLKKLLTD